MKCLVKHYLMSTFQRYQLADVGAQVRVDSGTMEHLCQHRGGICFCIDWTSLGGQVIKKGWMEHLKNTKSIVRSGDHCPHNGSRHQVHVRLRDYLINWLTFEERGTSLPEIESQIFSGGTGHSQWTRYCVEELFGGPAEESGVYMTPTYGNTLMGLACSEPVTKENKYKITYHAPQPRAATEVVSFDDPNELVGYGETGRVKLTTLTKELFIPGFLERDEAEREEPHEITVGWCLGRRPYHVFAKSTTVGY